MRYYDHTKPIKLRKTIIQYVSRVDGTFVWNYQIKWYKSRVSGESQCIINEKLYSKKDFDDVFVEYISRADELVEETKKYKSYGFGSKPFINELLPNHNGRIYTQQKTFSDHVTESVFNGIKNKMYTPFSYDIVAEPGYSEANLTLMINK